MKQRLMSGYNRESVNKKGQAEKDSWSAKLKPLQAFVVKNRVNQRLKLPMQKLNELSDLLDCLLGVRVNFFKTNLSVVELLNLVLSLFISSSVERSKILNTTAGTLRVASYRAKEKLNAHNRVHLVQVLFQNKIFVSNFVINSMK